MALAGGFSQFVIGPGGWRFVVAEVTLVVLTLALRFADSHPGPRNVRHVVRSRSDT